MAEFVQPILDRDEIASAIDVQQVTPLLNQAIDGGLDGDRSSGYYLWTLFSVGVLLSNLWLEPQPPKTTIRFPIPQR